MPVRSGGWRVWLGSFIVVWLFAALAHAAEAPPAPAPTPRRSPPVLGEVTAVDATGGTLTLRADDGRSIVVTPSATAEILKAKPGATVLDDATPLTLAGVVVGDRVMARGDSSGAGGSLQARRIVVMARTEIADKNARERDEWRQRGIGGVVTALDAAKQELTLQVRSPGGTRDVVVSTSEKKATFRRYAPDSVKFSDATVGGFGELQVGDQVRALGDASEDGMRFTAEQVVSGSFRMVIGAVETVDAEKGVVRVADAMANEKVLVTVVADTMLRRLTPELAMRLMPRGARGAGRNGAAGPTEQEARPDGERRERPADAGAEGEGRRGMPRRGANLGDLLERMLALALVELKPGDQIAASSTRGSAAGKLTAVAFVAGIEPLLAAQPGPGRREGGVDLTPGVSAGALDMGMGGF